MSFNDHTNLILFTFLTLVSGSYLLEPGIIGGEHYGVFMAIFGLSVCGLISTIVQYRSYFQKVDRSKEES